MSELGSQDAEIPKRGKPEPPFCWQGNEVYDVFLPIMGPDAFAVYAYFTRRAFIDPALKHTVRTLAEATGLGISTIARSLEILECVCLVKLSRFGGNRDSECRLLDAKAAAKRIGAKYSSQTVSYVLPSDAAQRLRAEITQLKEKQQGKASAKTVAAALRSCGNHLSCVSLRNAGVSPERRKRTTGETQTGTHLLRKERRNEEASSPTPAPSDEYEAQKDKGSPDEYEPEDLLVWARIKFNGVMKDMGDHLLDTSRPPAPHLANGAADWRDLCFDSLAVERARWRGETLELTVRASDPDAARRGLEKYKRRWNESLRKRYECEVEFIVEKPQR